MWAYELWCVFSTVACEGEWVSDVSAAVGGLMRWVGETGDRSFGEEGWDGVLRVVELMESGR